MDCTETISWYDANAPTLVNNYERLSAERVHGWVIDLLPNGGAAVLDVGAGSGRDAAWFASRGYSVVAVEPAQGMREAGMRLHPHAEVRWIDDEMPSLDRVKQLGLTFDFIMLSAVWMHLPAQARPWAMRTLISLLNPEGTLAISLRYGPPNENRPGMHAVSEVEVEQLSQVHAASVIRRVQSCDLERSQISWVQLAIRPTYSNASR